jgi:hypothetical protein
LALGPGTAPAPDVNDCRKAWWENGYLLRNEVVHEGRQANAEAAGRAVECAWELAAVVGEQLRSSADTAELGALLKVEWHRS